MEYNNQNIQCSVEIEPEKTLGDFTIKINNKNKIIITHNEDDWEIDYDNPLGKGNLSVGVYKAIKKNSSIKTLMNNSIYEKKLKNNICTIKIINKIGKYEFQTLDELINIDHFEYIVKFYGYAKGKLDYGKKGLISNESNINGDCLFIYMEYLEGYKSIEQLLEKGAFSEDRIRDITLKLVKTLIFLYEKKIIHRDIKCGNILYNESTGDIKVIDFGISRIFDDKSNHFTHIGTKSHMAPEILELTNQTCSTDEFIKIQAGSNSDVWSLGCTLIEMSGGDLKRDINGIPNVPNHLSKECKEFIRNCLIYNRFDRPRSNQLLDFKFLKIEKNCITEEIEINYDQFISKSFLIPDNIKTLIINQLNNIENENIFTLIPNNITKLVLPSFNSNIQLLSKIPTSITSLSLPVYNQKIVSFTIPSQITSLSIPSYNYDFEEDSINESIIELELGEIFEFKKNGGNLPSTIKRFKCNSIFDSQLTRNNNIPKNVIYLESSLRNDLQFLGLSSNDTYFDSLPPSIIELTLNVSNQCTKSDEEIASYIPKSIILNIKR